MMEQCGFETGVFIMETKAPGFLPSMLLSKPTRNHCSSHIED